MNSSAGTIITLSSDDESENESPKKKPKLTLRLNESVEELVILSDDDNSNYVVPANHKRYNNSTSEGKHKTKNDDDDVEVVPVADPIKSGTNNTFDVFLELCSTKVDNAKHKELLLEKISTIKLLYRRTSDYVTTDEFKESLEHKIKLLDEQPKHALHCFNIIFQQLKQAWKSQKNSEVDENRVRLIKKIQKKLDELHAKIRKLESAEMTIDDCEDEDSSYVQTQRYKQRAVQLYEKLCELDNDDAHADRIVYKKLRFTKSKYECINKAIRKRYRNNDVFPTYYDIDKLIRKCTERNKLKLSNTELEREVKQCFEALGNLLQKRRKQDLLDIHADYIACTEDPADKDDSLQSKLKANKKQGDEKLNKLCTEFVIKQENGEDYSEDEEPAATDDEKTDD